MKHTRSSERNAAQPAEFWSSAPPEVIEKALSQSAFCPDLACAAALRDRCAANVLTDPSLSYRLSSALMQAVNRKEGSLPPEVRATAWRCRAEASLFTGRLQAARKAYERASSDAEAAEQLPLLAQILVGRLHLLSLLGEAGEADRLARRAERLLKHAGDSIYLGKLYMNRGNAHYQCDRYQEAYTAYRKAARVLDQAGVRDATWAGLLMNQAIACTNLSRVKEARDLFLETEAHCNRLGLDALRAQARFNRAFLERLRGDYRSALALLEDAGATFERHGSRDLVAATQRARAEIYLDLGMAREAHDLARTATEAFAGEGMAIDAALARVDQASSLLETGEAAAAVPMLADAHDFFRKRGLRPRKAAVLLRLARAEQILGHHSRAATLARRAARAFESLNLAQGVSQSRRLLAEALLALKQPRRAERALAATILVTRNLAIGERLEFWRLAGEISRALGRRAEATRRLRRAAALLEAQRGLIPGVELRARAFARQGHVYDDLIAVALDSRSPRFATLFELVESARARSLRDRMSAEEPPAGWKRVAEKRALLGSLTQRLEETEFSGRGTPDAKTVGALRRQIRALERKVLDSIRRAEATERGTPEWPGAPNPNRIAAELAPQDALLEYFVVDDRVLLLLLRNDHRSIHLLGEPAGAIQTRVDRVWFQLQATALAARRGIRGLDFRRGAAEAALRDLYRSLLHPVAQLLPEAGRLIIVPHAFLHRVPFECLHDGRRYINERFLVSRSPSADLATDRSARVSPRRRKALICGLLKNGPAFAASEIDAVAACLPPKTTRVLRDPTSKQILREMARSRIIHLSTHGSFRGDNPLFSRLSTADGALFLTDILNVHLPAELVVLSACESGQILGNHGDDLSGVAHGFLAAGARCLVASQWRVHDEATRSLMEAFYKRYVATGGQATTGPGRDAALALNGAQREIRRSWDHPFYWAGFCVYGA